MSDEQKLNNGEVTVCEVAEDGSVAFFYRYRARCLTEGKTIGTYTTYESAQSMAKLHTNETGHKTSTVSVPT